MDSKQNEVKILIQQWLDSQEGASNTLIPQVWQALAEITAESEALLPSLTNISAEEVQLFVKDDETGRSFHRLIPLDYLETSNGITLSGETYAAQPSQIVFLTEFALGKILELQGQEDEHNHDHHHHD